ncbi:hypothetical protein [Streptomyces candidus]|uniref:Uncharacterized protein n=1 Tax=Streptomyces candidus TaxID=67283 RepID=A0A7X0HAG3_9ACTN|nr:hypothetical protein [Streptomyces candidus]MBB6433940.1 hypothetical protein [Streptomyces candidus]GHH33949.1 hypothetical protein GCM10018773_05330 [Streptomyces candidus]
MDRPDSSRYALRLLPWVTPDGHPCYLSTDGAGYLARLADRMEALQLDTGSEVLGHARELMGGTSVPPDALRFTATRLAECLSDVLRVAESRGRRLDASTGGEGEGDPHVPL